MKDIICKNCGFEFLGDKCPQCGYNVNVSNQDKLDMASMSLGIVSLCMLLPNYACSFWCAILGLIFGIKSKERTKKEK